MSDHPLMQAAVQSYVGVLLALGEIGIGWLLAFHSQCPVRAFDILKLPKSDILRKVVVIWGWVLMVIGGLCIAGYAIALVWLLFQH